ncbi:MAG: DUF2934 domain-containing protein [Steroidobacteraceae bacterium]
MIIRRTTETPRVTESGTRGEAQRGERSLRAKTTPARRLQVSPESRRAMVAEAAYLRAEQRGFAPGQETEDWLAAEIEVDALLRSEYGGPAQ